MSAAAADAQAAQAQVAQQQHQPSKASHDYKGFVAGVGSGIAKLTGAHAHAPLIRYISLLPLQDRC